MGSIDHPFHVQCRGFIEAGSLLVGDKLVSANSEDLVIEKFYIEETKNSVDVYNFQVEDFHTYHVGENGVLVHNAEKYVDESKSHRIRKLFFRIKINIQKSFHVKGAAVYKGKDGNYYYRDTFHTGESVQEMV